MCPHLAVALYEAFCAGEIEKARQCQRDLTLAWNIFKYGSIWGGFDEALRYLRIAERATGAPYVTSLNADDALKVHEIIDRYVRPYAQARGALEYLAV